MSIRKVSDLPALENLAEKIQDGQLSSHLILFEVSEPKSIEGSEDGKYLSRSITFDELVNAVKSKLSGDYSKWATPEQDGLIKTGYPNDLNKMRYGLSTDSNNRGFIQFDYIGENWTFTLSGQSAPQTIKKKVFASTI